MEKVTIKDVAEKAGVSKSTVSQYLNKRYEYMSNKTRKTIEETIMELDYKPNIIARSLKMKKTTTIGIIVANILHEFSTQVIRSIENICNEAGFNIIVCNADDSPLKEKEHLIMLRAKQVDGIIAFPTGDNRDLYKELYRENYPIVFIDRYLEGINIPSVLLNNEMAVELAIKEFKRKNKNNLSIITTSIERNISPRIERLNGFKNMLIKHEIKVREELIYGTPLDKLDEVLNELMNLQVPPDAILAGNDRVLLGILKFLKKNKYKIPEDISVIGIDDVAYADIYNPPITTIAQPTYLIGETAAKLILSRVNNKKSKDTFKKYYRFNPKINLRQSI